MKHYNKSIRGLSIFGNIGAVTIAALGLLSYMPGLGLLGSIREDYIPMAPSTAISFIILACCLYAMNTTMLSRLKLGISFTAVILVLLFGFLEVLGFYLGMDLNFEESIVPAAGHLNGIPIARMSPATGSVFFLSGIAVTLLILRYKIPEYRIWLKHTGGILGVLVIITSFTFLFVIYLWSSIIIWIWLNDSNGFDYGISFFAPGNQYNRICREKNSFPVRYLIGPGISSYLLRYILSLSTLSVVIGGIAVSHAHHVSKINPALASAFLTVIITFATGVVAILISRHIGNVIDRAEKMIAETANSLSESEERFKAIFEQSGGCFLILEPKPDGSLIIVDANESACKFHGYTKYELVGKSFSELSVGTDKTLDVKHIEKILSGEPYVEETTHSRKDGTNFPMISYYCRIQLGKSLPLILSAEYDITDRKKAEEKLRESEELLNEVGNIAMIGGWEINLINHRSIWTKGTYDIVEIEPNREPPGQDEHINYYLPEYRDMVRKNIQQLIDENITLDYEAKLKTAKGNIKWGHAYGKAVRENGKCVKIYGTFQDITARKKD